MSIKAFRSPGRYIQGKGVLNSLGKETAELGTKAFILSDEVVWGLLSEKIEQTFANSNATFTYNNFMGEASENEIKRLGKDADKNGADVIVALGGGKAIDTAKALADDVNKPVIIVPTIASTDAPTSALSVIYTDDGAFEGYRFYTKNPDLVLVDTEVIVNAPASLFAAGIADAMATCVEATATNKANGDTMAGGKPTLAAQAIANYCQEILFRDGVAAYTAVQNKVITQAVDNVTEANTLLSGLGFENGGLAGAHAVHNGFTALEGDIHHVSHGGKVAYGTLTQLVLENRPIEELKKFIKFYQAIDMPTTLEEIHLDKVEYSDLVKVGELANAEGDTMGNVRADITAEEVADAIIAVDAISKALQ